MKKPEEKHLDVLQNIELGIVQVYRADKSLLDLDVKDAADALVRHYQAEEDLGTPPTRRLGERSEKVFLSVQTMCEWRLGNASPSAEAESVVASIPIHELVGCLRRIQKSIKFWSQQGGRKAYLDFIIQYLP